MKTVQCDYCGQNAELVNGQRIYPNRPDLKHLKFWLCEPCKAYVGTHKPNCKHGFDGTDPLGRLANAELRLEKQKAHAAFDPLWKSGQMTRREAYAWLSEATGIDADRCHIGMMDVAGCLAVVNAVRAR